ncbi:hypothetical protein D3C77_273140 [compost metagenome]
MCSQGQGVEPGHHRQQVGLQVGGQFFRGLLIRAHRCYANELGFQTVLDLGIEGEVVIPGGTVEVAGSEQVETIITDVLQARMPVTQQVLLGDDEGFHRGAIDQIINAPLTEILAVQRLPALHAELVDGALMLFIKRRAQCILHVDEGPGVDIDFGRAAPVLIGAEDPRILVVATDLEKFVDARLLCLAGLVPQRLDIRIRFAQGLQTRVVDVVQGLDVSAAEVLGLTPVISTPLLDPVSHFQLGSGQIAHHANVVAQQQKQVIILVGAEYLTGQCFNLGVVEQRLVFPVVRHFLLRVDTVGKGFGRRQLGDA